MRQGVEFRTGLRKNENSYITSVIKIDFKLSTLGSGLLHKGYAKVTNHLLKATYKFPFPLFPFSFFNRGRDILLSLISKMEMEIVGMEIDLKRVKAACAASIESP